MDGIINWIKLNPHIATIIVLIILLIVVVKVVKKIVVTGIFIGIILLVFVFKGNIFPQAMEGKKIIDNIQNRGKEYIQSAEYKNDFNKLKENYPGLVKIVEEKTKEILGE